MESKYKKKRYTIREAARLVGISSEALRYYERENIISSLRNADNGYRFYDKYAILRLTNSKYLRSYNLSIKEISNVFQKGTPSALASLVLRKKEDIQELIRWYQLVEDYMGKYAKKLENLESSVNQIEITESPELLYFLHHQDMDLFSDPVLSKLYPLWVDKMPLVKPLTFCTRDAFLTAPPLLRQGGLGIYAEEARIAGLDTQKAPIRRIPPQKCIRTIIVVENKPESLHNRFAPVLAYIHDNGLSLAGDVWGFLLFINYKSLPEGHSLEKEVGPIYYEYYLPVQ